MVIFTTNNVFVWYLIYDKNEKTYNVWYVIQFIE